MKKTSHSFLLFAFLFYSGFQMRAQNLIFPEGASFSYKSIASVDGNLLTLSHPSDWPLNVHLTKMEPDGDVLWTTGYESEIIYYPDRIFTLADGSIYVFSYEGMIKFDASGDVLFEMYLDPAEFGYEPIPGETDINTNDVIQLEDGFEILSDGYAFAPTNSRFHVVTKIDFSGEPVWSYSYILDDAYGFQLLNKENKSFVFLSNYGIENEVEIIDDLTGDLISSTTLPGSYPRDIQDVGTGIVFAGVEETTSDKLVKLNYDGEILWTRDFPFADVDSINGIIEIEELSSGNLVGLILQGNYPGTKYILRFYTPEGYMISEIDEFADYEPMFFNDFKIQNDQLIFTGDYSDWPTQNGIVLLADSTGNFFQANIAGQIYYDENGNDIRDIGEHLFKDIIVNSDVVPYYGITNDSGEYLIRIYETGMYHIEVENPAYWDLNEPSLYTVEIDAGMGDDTIYDNDFRLDYTAPVTDLQIYVDENNVIPGTATNMYAYIKNYGNQFDINATGYLQHPSELTYVTGTPYDSYMDTTFTWSTPPLDPGDTYLFEMQFDVDEDLDLGEILTTTANVEPLAGDYNPIDNYSIDYELVVESYDPNHKTASPEGVGINGSTDPETEWIEYTIEFQNLGTAPANFINVIDTIDNDFQFTSIEMIAATHQYEMELISPNIVQWHFENINLPDSASDPLGSIGHIIFRLKIKEDAVTGTELTNTAAIYFDYNQPVITNTTLNTLEELPEVGIKEELINGMFSIYPNPVGDELTIELLNPQNKSCKAALFNLNGMQLRTFQINSGKNTIQVSTKELNPGMYFIRIIDSENGNVGQLPFIRN